MGLSGEHEILRSNQLLIAVSAVIVLSFIGLLHFDPGVVSGLNPLFTALLGIRIPDLWTYIEPVMPFLNVFFYLLGALAILLIGKEYIITDRYIYLAVAAYLIYFPLSGINWSTFDTICIFPSLYLLGFYFYKIDERVISAFFFILSGATFLIFIILVIFSGVGILVKDRKSNIMAWHNHLALSLILISFLLFFLSLTQSYFIGFYGPVDAAGYGFLLKLVSTITFAKSLFFIVLLVPLITFGFFGPRLLPITIPYYIFGIIVAAAGTIPEPLVALLDFVMPLAYIGTIRWIGRKVDGEVGSQEPRILKFVLFSLILMNILVFISYIPFISVLSKFFGL